MPHDMSNDATTWHWPDSDLEKLQRLADLVAFELKRGDCVRLIGDLGAGKTTFATCLLRAYADENDLTVPSPTFTLIERYDLPRGVIHHADLYRLEEPDEADELGLEDAQDEGALLIEWPEKAPHAAGKEHLTVTFSPTSDDTTRDIAVTPTPAWRTRLERLKRLNEFANQHIESTDRISHLQGDASARRYAVVRGETDDRIIMDAPEQPDGPVVEDGKTYSAIAHLAESVSPFVAVAEALRDAGICVPDIKAADLDNGLLLISHLGDGVFGKEIDAGTPQRDLYLQAAYVLLQLRKHHVPDALELPNGKTHVVSPFDWPAFWMEARLFTDWYIPAAAGNAAPEERCRTFKEIWTELFKLIDGHNNWIIRDYHSPNLIYRPQATKLDRVGVIDFQDALRGHAAYDLVSLLQDARLDVSQDLELELLQRYCDAARDQGPFDVADFCTAYAILGAQRSTKILGIFARLAKRDGKPQYLAHVPRIWGYLERNMRHEALIPLQTWYSESVPHAWRELKELS